MVSLCSRQARQGARNACSEGLVRGNSELVGAFLNLASNNAKALAPLVAFSCARAPPKPNPIQPSSTCALARLVSPPLLQSLSRIEQ